jgi:hypothetical protein
MDNRLDRTTRRPRMTPEERVLAGRVFAHRRWSHRTEAERRADTEAARRGFAGRFERQVRAEHPDASDADVIRMAESRRKAHMSELALRSSQARRRRR